MGRAMLARLDAALSRRDVDAALAAVDALPEEELETRNSVGFTPLSLARALRAAGEATDGSAAQLVLAAAEPWGPRTHALFPAAARAFAVEVLLLGHQLSRQPRFAGEEGSIVDIWTGVVMPSAVSR